MVGLPDQRRVLDHMTLTLRRDADQEAALDAFADAQQDRTSPYFHQWLSNDEYAAHFAVSKHDIGEVVAWLKAGGFTVDTVSPTGWRIMFTGTVAQVEAAFHTRIQSYRDGVSGATHFANATEPQVPEALSGVIEGVIGLHDYVPQPGLQRPAGTKPAFECPNHDCADNTNYLAPADLSAIYGGNMSLYTGTSTTIAVVARCTP
jgi:subtilase family serine protease